MATLNFSVNGTFYTGFYEVVGAFIIVECQHGVSRAALGLQKPQKLARQLLRSVVLRGASLPAAVPDAVAIRHAKTNKRGAPKAATLPAHATRH